MKRSLHVVVFSVLSLMLCCSMLMAAFWLPRAIEHISKYIFTSSPLPLYFICAAIALPFLGIIVAAFTFPFSIYKDTVFTAKTSKHIKVISVMLFADCAMLLAASTAFVIAGDLLLSPALIFISLIGMTVALMLFILSQYVKRAAILKEENDYTL